VLLAACNSSSPQATPSTGDFVTTDQTRQNVKPEGSSMESSTAEEGEQNGQSEPSIPPLVKPVTIDLSTIPQVDTSKHNVPPEEVYFDTFRPVNRAVSLDRATPELIRSLLDAIPPIYNPVFETAESADRWIGDTDLVLGFASGGEAYAYPINILNFHEMVRHEVDGIPVLATFCPLCRSGIVYDSTVQGEALLFGNTSALYESDMVMVDHKTGSYWMQVSGESIVGPLTGERLRPLPSQTTTWGLWKEQHPHTFSLSRNTGYSRDYNRNPFTGFGEQLNTTGRFAFPVSEKGRDGRLDPGEVVFGVQIDGIQRAYPIARIGDGVVNDVVGETAITIFSRAEGSTGAVFSPNVNGRNLTFEFVDGSIRDRETGSNWSFSGEAITGELRGMQLEALASRSTFWFALAAAFPGVEIYVGDG
jgi:hypothetical protein